MWSSGFKPVTSPDARQQPPPGRVLQATSTRAVSHLQTPLQVQFPLKSQQQVCREVSGAVVARAGGWPGRRLPSLLPYRLDN